jgi:hypothetical protein
MDPRQPADDIDEDTLEGAIEGLFQTRMASPAWVSDAQGDFTQEEYDAITAMVIGRDALALGEKLIESVQRVIRAGCERDSDELLEKMRREAEDEAATARAGY